jgi:hypothetical protein
MNSAEPQTGRGGSTNGSLASGIAIKLNTAVNAIWMIARFMASTLGANLLIKITCNAQQTAHPMTNNSPRPIENWNELLIEMSDSPTTERSTPNMLSSVGFWRNIGTARIATSGTYMPVIKPALLEVVYCKPVVWNAYAPNKKRPIIEPVIISVIVICANRLWNIIASTRAPILKRIVRNEKGPISLIVS